MRRGLLLVALTATVVATGACETPGNARLGDPGAVGPLAGLAMGVTSAAVSRASGSCYAACPVGTTCNPATGLCDELPCRGRCGEGEECVKAGLTQKCVALGLPGSVVVQPPTATSKPAPPPEGTTQVPAGERSDVPLREAAPPPP